MSHSQHMPNRSAWSCPAFCAWIDSLKYPSILAFSVLFPFLILEWWTRVISGGGLEQFRPSPWWAALMGIYFICLIMVIFRCLHQATRNFLGAATQEFIYPLSSSQPAADHPKMLAHWFIAMRWMAIWVISVLVVLTVKFLHWLPSEVWWPLVSIIGGLVAANLFYTLLLQGNRGTQTVLLIQGYLDLVLLCLLIQFSGGVENPLATVMIFHVIISGIILNRRHCYGIAAVGSLLYSLIIWLQWNGNLPHYSLDVTLHYDRAGVRLHEAYHSVYVLGRAGLQSALLFFTAQFVTSLVERLRHNERRLETLAEMASSERQLLESALETTGTGLRVISCESDPIWHNRWWKEWFIDHGTQQFSRHSCINHLNSPARQTFKDGLPRVTEVVCPADPTRDPTAPLAPIQRVFQITTAPLKDAKGAIRQIFELAQDITQRKQMQLQILHASKLAAVGHLAGRVAHEVNNPIAIISAKVHVLLTDRRAEMSNHITAELRKIEHLAQRVGHIAKGLLSSCRPSPSVHAWLDLREPIRRSLSMIESHAKRVGIKIIDQLPDTLPRIKANQGELEQVFLNLFLNALDAMPQGGQLKIQASPEVMPKKGNPGIAVQVEDAGLGIPPEVQAQVFEPFFTTKKTGLGSGLGLSICNGLIRSHGGELALKSQTGQGTCVTVYLPIDAPSPLTVKYNNSHG